MRIFIVTGEASGDLHGANLIKAIKEYDPGIHISGIGGKLMSESGCEVIFDSSKIAVVGIFEVISHLKYIISAYIISKRYIKNNTPDLIILIDYPDFNLRLAKMVNKIVNRKIPIIYYISPQIWAWRRGRVKKMAKLIDKMIVVFPFELEIYKKARMDVEFVGHPLIDVVRPKLSREEAIKKFGLDNREIIALLPGSRKSEIKRILPEMIKAADIIGDRFQYIIPIASTLNREYVERYIRNSKVKIYLIEGWVYDILNISEIAVVASGTATLETALINKPMIIVYKVSPLTYMLGRLLISVNNIGMVNLVGGESIIPELIQKDVNPVRIAKEVMDIIDNNERKEFMKAKLNSIREMLGEKGVYKRAANIIYNFLRSRVNEGL